jgi:hypothetical protein
MENWEPMGLTREELERWLRQAIATRAWRATIYIAPHEYVMEPPDSPLLRLMFEYRNRYGYKTRFGRRTYHYVDLDGFRYWMMSESHEYPGQEKVINRAVGSRNEPDPQRASDTP